jgi:hypothetical protein
MQFKVGAVLFFLFIAMAGFAAEHKSAIVPNPAFDKMKTLDGVWVGTAIEGGKELPTNTRFMLVSDDSALMSWLNEGTPAEMVTMFHMDGSDLMATHYCSAHNQPRMIVVPSDNPKQVLFRFKDGTNIGPHDGHMQEVAFILDGPDHHVQVWTYVDEQGKVTTARFDFKRKP